MKKPILICLLAILALNACKKSNSTSANQNVSITGKWYETQDVYTVTNKSGVITPVETQTFNHTYSVTFNSDGTGIGNDDGNFTPTFSYSTASGILNLTETVIINSAPYTTTFKTPIKKLTNNSLELYFSITDPSDGHSENHDATYTK